MGRQEIKEVASLTLVPVMLNRHEASGPSPLRDSLDNVTMITLYYRSFMLLIYDARACPLMFLNVDVNMEACSWRVPAESVEPN
jgi:hypothetical protein